MSFVVFSVVLMIPVVMNQETPGYYFAGGILGIISSVRIHLSLSSHQLLSRATGNRSGSSSAEWVKKIFFNVAVIFSCPVRHGDRIPLRNGWIFQPKFVSEEPMPHLRWFPPSPPPTVTSPNSDPDI
jgi:hypothetical protein